MPFASFLKKQNKSGSLSDLVEDNTQPPPCEGPASQESQGSTPHTVPLLTGPSRHSRVFCRPPWPRSSAPCPPPPPMFRLPSPVRAQPSISGPWCHRGHAGHSGARTLRGPWDGPRPNLSTESRSQGARTHRPESGPSGLRVNKETPRPLQGVGASQGLECIKSSTPTGRITLQMIGLPSCHIHPFR